MPNIIEIRITLSQETGEIKVIAPMHNKILCLGMLEMANAIVKDHSVKDQGGSILNPTLVTPGNFGKGS